MPNLIPTDPITSPIRPIPESYWALPGRLLAGEYPAALYAAEITRKRLDSFLTASFTTYINLTSPGELEDYQPLLKEQAGYFNLTVECLRYPIGDYGLPSIETMRATLDAIDASLARGCKIYLHCYGGIGRTGTTVGCFLVRHGLTGKEALHRLAGWWQTVPKSARYPHSPETVQQEEFICNWPEQGR